MFSFLPFVEILRWPGREDKWRVRAPGKLAGTCKGHGVHRCVWWKEGVFCVVADGEGKSYFSPLGKRIEEWSRRLGIKLVFFRMGTIAPMWWMGLAEHGWSGPGDVALPRAGWHQRGPCHLWVHLKGSGKARTCCCPSAKEMACSCWPWSRRNIWKKMNLYNHSHNAVSAINGVCVATTPQDTNGPSLACKNYQLTYHPSSGLVADLGLILYFHQKGTLIPVYVKAGKLIFEGSWLKLILALYFSSYHEGKWK